MCKTFVKDKKGYSLVELLIVFAILAIITPVIFSLLYYGIEDFQTNSKNLDQHKKVLDIMQVIRKDIEEASEVQAFDKKLVILAESGSTKYWKFDGDTLKFSSDDTTYNIALTGLSYTLDALNNKIPESTFEKSMSVNDRIIVKIKPQNSNASRYQERNISNPIITEFSVRYKK